MKILFISHTYPPAIGGMQKQSYELINGFKNGLKDKGKDKEKAFVLSLVHNKDKESKLMFFLKLKRRVKKILKAHPDLTLIHLNDGLMGIFALRIRKLTYIPIFVTIHGLDIIHPSHFFQKHLIKRLKNAYQGFIAVSSAVSKECLKRGFSSQSVYVVKNGVDTKIATIKEEQNFIEKLEKRINTTLKGKKIILSIGRPIKRKGFSWFIDNVVRHLDKDVLYITLGPTSDNIKILSFLLKLLPKSLANTISLFFGFELDQIDIKRLSKDKDIAGRVFCISNMSFYEIIQTLKVSKLFVMPNIEVAGDLEGFGLVSLEAALAGTPVVCSAIEGIKDAVIDNCNGFHVRASDKDAWIKKIKELLQDDFKLKEFGKDGCSYVLANYSWQKMTDGYMQIFKEHIKQTEKLKKKEKINP